MGAVRVRMLTVKRHPKRFLLFQEDVQAVEVCTMHTLQASKDLGRDNYLEASTPKDQCEGKVHERDGRTFRIKRRV